LSGAIGGEAMAAHDKMTRRVVEGKLRARTVEQSSTTCLLKVR
jgi:hypothetical protein